MTLSARRMSPCASRTRAALPSSVSVRFSAYEPTHSWPQCTIHPNEFTADMQAQRAKTKLPTRKVVRWNPKRRAPVRSQSRKQSNLGDPVNLDGHLLQAERREAEPSAARLERRRDLRDVVADHAEPGILRVLLDDTAERGLRVVGHGIGLKRDGKCRKCGKVFGASEPHPHKFNGDEGERLGVSW